MNGGLWIKHAVEKKVVSSRAKKGCCWWRCVQVTGGKPKLVLHLRRVQQVATGFFSLCISGTVLSLTAVLHKYTALRTNASVLAF